MHNTDLEFRVLTGLQAGARIRLPSGSYTIGTDLDCDIVVQGQNIELLHLTLVINDGQILIQPGAGECGTENGILGDDGVLSAGQLFRAARMWLQIAQANAPWPTSEEIFATDSNAKTELIASDDTAAVQSLAATVDGEEADSVAITDKKQLPDPGTGSSVSASSVEIGDATTGEASVPHLANARSPKTRWRIGVLSASMLAAVFLGGIAISLVTPGSARTSTEPLSDKNKIALAEESVACATGVTTKLELQKRITITNDGRGNVTATGYTSKGNELTSLQKKMSELCPTVRIAVSVDEVLAQQVKSALTRQGGGWALQSLRQGRAVVNRVTAGTRSLSDLQTTLMQEIDGLASVEQTAVELAVIRQSLNAMLEQAQLAPRITTMVKSNRVYVTGDPTLAEAARWTPILAQLQQTYGVDLPVTVEFENRRNALPFQIREVVGGSMPFIVIADGPRLFEGGSYEGYQLISIKDHKIVFGGKQTVEINW